MLALNLAIVITVPVILGVAVSYYLQQVSTRLLSDLCQTQIRAEFWVRVLNVLYLGVPLFLALCFTPNPQYADPATVLQRSILAAMLGLICAILIVAQRIISGVRTATQPGLPEPEVKA